MRSSSSSRLCSSSLLWRTSPRASGWNDEAGLKACATRTEMTIDYAIGLVITAGLLVYLTYALLRPEKF